MKVCKECGVEKPKEEFYKRSHRNSRMARCKACIGNKQREYREENREKQNEYFKQRRRENKLKSIGYLGGSCAECGEEFIGRPEVFAFHHIDRSTKERKPAELMSCAWDTIVEELDKCILVCHNCHATITKGEQ